MLSKQVKRSCGRVLEAPERARILGAHAGRLYYSSTASGEAAAGVSITYITYMS